MTDETQKEPLVLTDNVGERIKALLDLRKIAESEKLEGDRAASAARTRIGEINDQLRQIVDLPIERGGVSALSQAYDAATNVGMNQLNAQSALGRALLGKPPGGY